MKHTPEPWAFSDGLGHYEGCVVITSGEMTGSTPLAVISDICGDADIDARRIVACVNFCKGMDTDDIDGVLALGSDALTYSQRKETEINDIKSQRDELLAALKPILEKVRDFEDCVLYGRAWQSDELINEIKTADAVIAKYEAKV